MEALRLGEAMGLPPEQLRALAQGGIIHDIGKIEVYDAVTSNRSYRKPWSHEEAVALIVRESGRHFDPDCVAAWGASPQRCLPRTGILRGCSRRWRPPATMAPD